MGELLIATVTSIGLVLFVLTLATHMTLWGDFKYYKPIYKSFKRGDYEYSPIGNHIYFKKGYDEMIFFPDGAIQLTNGTYIHLSFINWFSPYSLYYTWKFKKVKDSLIYHHQLNEMHERELDRWRDNPFADSHFADYGPIGPVGFRGRPGPNGNETPVVKDIKPFKFFRG